MPHTKLQFQLRSVMLVPIVVALIVWGAVLWSRSARFLAQSRQLHAAAAQYAISESQYADAINEVAELDRAVADAEPPSARADDRAWRAYREYLAKLKHKLNAANARLDSLGGYRALRRRSERLATEFERAAMRPWLSVNSDTPGAF
jgi:hypothetical protein